MIHLGWLPKLARKATAMNHAVKLPLALVLLVLTHQDPAAAVVRGFLNQLAASPLLQADHAQSLIVISQTGPAEGAGSELVGTAWRLVEQGHLSIQKWGKVAHK